MVQYNNERTPGLPPWTGGTMNATLVLDQIGNVTFTNLDQISGRVILRCARSADITSIIVKLEGESRTRLLSPPRQNGEKPKPQLEYHKILYKTQIVFPPPDVLRNNLSSTASYTLPPGQHEYRFDFKIPFNNGCSINRNQVPAMLSFEGVKPASIHVKQTLPPTLSGFPGEAEIRYFVKATVSRSSMFKENPRAFAPFNFFPIEPPRKAASGAEVFARQRTTLGPGSQYEAPKSKIKGLFSKGVSEPASPAPNADTTSHISIDARLPEPAILTCNSELPLRIIVKKLTESNQMLYLQSIQVALIGYTKIRAHDVFRTETTSWIITSKSNMGIPIGAASDSAGTETAIDDRLWRGQPLPNNIAPNFITCNIERTYQLDVRVGISSAGASQSAAKGPSMVVPLRLNAVVYSGIAPPEEVLARMAKTKTNVPTTSQSAVDQKLQNEGRRTSEFGSNQIPISPIDSSEEPMAGSFPVQQGAASSTEHPAEYEDAPPSYEDAIASDVPSVAAGNRPVYAPPPSGQDPILRQDEKRAWVG